MWTKFFDMSSGGYEKTDYCTIIVEGDEQSAAERFEKEFDVNPYNTTCVCCGPDFSIYVYDTLEEAKTTLYPGYSFKVIYKDKE